MHFHGDRFEYIYESLLKDPPWYRTVRVGGYWTDGYGGSTHTRHPSYPGFGSWDHTGHSVRNRLYDNCMVVTSVFPPKPFDFERLYG